MKDTAAFNNKEQDRMEGELVDMADATVQTKGAFTGGWDGGIGLQGMLES